MSGEHSKSSAGRNQGRLMIVFGLTTIYLIAEVIGGWLTQSLALLADAGHMLTDVGGIGLALLAIRFASRPATQKSTYGFYRVEILAAVINAVVLIGISLFILYEAYRRIQEPPEVASGWMLLVAAIGLVVNLAGISLLHAGSAESLNLKGAYYEVLSDTLTSIGVIAAALIMWATDWYYADPLFSAGIGLFILPRTWLLLREAVHVLLQGTPAELDLAAVREAIGGLNGVAGVHDLHAWALTSGVNNLSAHVVLQDGVELGEVLTAIHQRVTADFPVHHATVQVEPQGWEGDHGETHA